MSILKVIVLAIVQGVAELLPVSSSAHVVVAEKLMGLDPSAPQMTLLLVMLHTGTMFAIIAFFWNTWKTANFSSKDAFRQFAVWVIWATLLTGIVGEVIKKIIEKTLFHGAGKAEIEQLFSRRHRQIWNVIRLSSPDGRFHTLHHESLCLLFIAEDFRYRHPFYSSACAEGDGLKEAPQRIKLWRLSQQQPLV